MEDCLCEMGDFRCLVKRGLSQQLLVASNVSTKAHRILGLCLILGEPLSLIPTVLVYPAGLHDETHVFQDLDVAARVSSHSRDVA